MTSLAPQFLVDNLERSIEYYRKLGFSFGDQWGGFYAIGELDGLEVHLKEAPKNLAERQWRRDNEHLDASAGVDGIEAFYEQCVADGITIIKPLAATDWGTKDFYTKTPMATSSASAAVQRRIYKFSRLQTDALPPGP